MLCEATNFYPRGAGDREGGGGQPTKNLSRSITAVITRATLATILLSVSSYLPVMTFTVFAQE